MTRLFYGLNSGRTATVALWPACVTHTLHLLLKTAPQQGSRILLKAIYAFYAGLIRPIKAIVKFARYMPATPPATPSQKVFR